MSSEKFYHTGLGVGRDTIQTLVDGHGRGDHYYVDFGTGYRYRC